MSKVNLDALIPREDFIADGNNKPNLSQLTNIGLPQLLAGENDYSSIYHLLKKPDFQRETNEWDKDRIVDLIESFIDHAFIPSIILWENKLSGNIYVIDGAHRLSAILAYVNNDYGDRAISNSFYQFKIPEAEIDLANETRDYIERKIGSFENLMKSGGEKANGLKLGSFDVQMIQGDVAKAEDSFFKINQQGVVLSPTERELCKSRHKPSCIATRAIIKGGAGTAYWKNFSDENQTAIKSLSEQLNRLLFVPTYKEPTVSIILHHPLGGSITIATPMIFDLMKIIKEHYFNNTEIEDKVSGQNTLNYLHFCRKIIWKLFSEAPGSLGLFPTVYFYNKGGKYIQSAFLGIAQLFIENDSKDDYFLPIFIRVRKELEFFLIKYKVFITQINRKYGSKAKSYRHMKGFFENLIYSMDAGMNEVDLLKYLKDKYDFLNEKESEIEKRHSKRFSIDTKVAFKIQEELDNALKCKLCGGFLHPLSSSADHKTDLKYGGKSNIENMQQTHIYCNMSKDKLIEKGVFIK